MSNKLNQIKFLENIDRIISLYENCKYLKLNETYSFGWEVSDENKLKICDITINQLRKKGPKP